MSSGTLLAIEAMAGVERMRQHAEHRGHRLVLLAEDPSMYSSDSGTTEVVEFPTRDHSQLDAYVAEHLDEIANVFSPTDTWGVAAAEIREKFGFASRITSGKLRLLRDKSWVQERITGQDPSDEIGFPRIVKPRGGTGSTQVTLVTDERELERAIAGFESEDDAVVQPFHHGPLYSAEIWSDGRTLVFFGVTNRIMTPPPRFLERVKSFPHAVGTTWEQTAADWVRQLAGALEYDAGFAHIEFIETTAGFQLVELNARMGGALVTPAVDACTNYDPYAMVVDDALGIMPDLPQERRITGGYSHVSIYAEQCGVFAEAVGVEALSHYPGEPGWIPSKDPGAEITSLDSYRARIGNIYATGPSAALAQDRALSAALGVRVVLE